MELWHTHDVLLDTCTMLWLAGGKHRKLGKRARKAIDEATNVYASCMSYAEILCKVEIGKLSLSMNPESFWQETLAQFEISQLQVDDKTIAVAFGELPYTHKDPVDRMILATAIQHDLLLLTPDPHIAGFKRGMIVWD